MLRAVGTLLVLAASWLAWSGHYTLEDTKILAFGAVSVLGVLAIAMRMQVVDQENPPLQINWRLILYVPWLFWEIIKANIDVAKVILDGRMPMRRRLLRVKASQRSEVGQVIYANSITLTPGTVTLDLRDGELLVHALTSSAAEGLQSGEMDRKVRWLRGER